MHLTLATVLSLLSLSTVTVGAQSASSSSASNTGSGSSLSSSSDPRAADRAQRAVTLRRDREALAAKQAKWSQQTAAMRAKRAEHRVACRADMRQANRDTKLSTLLRCYRGDLTLEREWLRQEREYVSGLPVVSEGVRTNLKGTLDALLDAVNTVVFAIDSSVYAHTEAVAEARTKLRQKYRAPAWQARTQLRADLLLSEVDLLLSDLTEEAAPAARECFLTQETALRSIVGGSGNLLKAVSGLRECTFSLALPASLLHTPPDVPFPPPPH